MSKKYVLSDNDDPTMALKQFKWRLDDYNNVALDWDWPAERNIRLILLYELSGESDNEPDVGRLLQEGHHHEVMIRDLATSFSSNITEGRRRYLLCPGYFDDKQIVVVHKLSSKTDWLYKKTIVTTEVVEKPLSLSQFKHISLRVAVSDNAQMSLVSRALKYVIYEDGRALGEYPLDVPVMSGVAGFYVKKSQVIRFSLDENFAHLLILRNR